jgi:hypothetical protein
MRVIDLIIQLQKLDQDLEVYIDQTSEHAGLFKFAKAINLEKCDIGTGNEVLLITDSMYKDDETENNDFKLN